MTTPEQVEEALEQVAAEMRERLEAGHIQIAGEIKTGIAYTIGLMNHAHPELVVMDMDPPFAYGVLAEVTSTVVRGGSLSPGDVIEPPADYDGNKKLKARVIDVGSDVIDQMIMARKVMGHPPVAVQIQYSDAEGRFPDEDNYDGPSQSLEPGPEEA